MKKETKIKLLNRTTSTVTTDTFELEVNGRKFVYIEYLDDKRKVIDCNLRDEIGNEVENAELLGRIQDFVDDN